jgi:hypothetical protein
VGVSVRLISRVARVSDAEAHQLASADTVRCDLGKEHGKHRNERKRRRPVIIFPCAREAVRAELVERGGEKMDKGSRDNDARTKVLCKAVKC